MRGLGGGTRTAEEPPHRLAALRRRSRWAACSASFGAAFMHSDVTMQHQDTDLNGGGGVEEGEGRMVGGMGVGGGSVAHYTAQ